MTEARAWAILAIGWVWSWWPVALGAMMFHEHGAMLGMVVRAVNNLTGVLLTAKQGDR